MLKCLIILLILVLLSACDQQQHSTPVTNVYQAESVVALCADKQPVYPSTFPEYALCIDNRLYAVYWDGTNSWLTEILPGAYKSTSTSAPCNFTVSVNCTVTEN